MKKQTKTKTDKQVLAEAFEGIADVADLSVGLAITLAFELGVNYPEYRIAPKGNGFRITRRPKQGVKAL